MPVQPASSAPRERASDRAEFAVTMADIADRLAIVPNLQAEIERFHYILNAIPFLIASIDLEQRYQFLNRAYEGINWFGRPRETMIGMTIREAVGDAEYFSVQPYIERVLNGETVEYDIETTSEGSKVRYRHTSYLPCRNPLTGRVVGFISIVQDVTQQKDAEEQVRWLAYHDSLTRLPNRALFHDRMDQAIARASRAKESIALLYIDLDGFKPVNDVFGHDRGDFLLQQVASRLVESVRTEDTVCRLGGDEFVILLPFLANSEEPVLIAQRIHTALEPVFAILPSAQKISNPPKLSACIGISIFPDHGADTETLLRHADQAMYQAKAEGPGSFSVYHRSGKL